MDLPLLGSSKRRIVISSAFVRMPTSRTTGFYAYNVVECIIKIRKLKAENLLLKRKLDFIEQQLKGLSANKYHKLTKKKDYLQHIVDQTHGTLTNLRTQASDILVKKHIIEIAKAREAKEQELDLPKCLEWLLSHDRENGDYHDKEIPLSQQLPDLCVVTAKYYFQQRLIGDLNSTIDSTSRLVDKLLSAVKKQKRSTENGSSQIKSFPVYKQSSVDKLENFDYYGYSPAGPIVPPLDLSWCSSPRTPSPTDMSIPRDISLRDHSPSFNNSAASHDEGQKRKLFCKKKNIKSTKQKAITNVLQK